MKRKYSLSNISVYCPNCKMQYLISEIYNPSLFIGNANPVCRDRDGKIENFSGDLPKLSAKFICDRCEKEFEVTADISLKAELCEDFEEDFTYEIYKPVELSEE